MGWGGGMRKGGSGKVVFTLSLDDFPVTLSFNNTLENLHSAKLYIKVVFQDEE